MPGSAWSPKVFDHERMLCPDSPDQEVWWASSTSGSAGVGDRTTAGERRGSGAAYQTLAALADAAEGSRAAQPRRPHRVGPQPGRTPAAADGTAGTRRGRDCCRGRSRSTALLTETGWAVVERACPRARGVGQGKRATVATREEVEALTTRSLPEPATSPQSRPGPPRQPRWRGISRCLVFAWRAHAALGTAFGGERVDAELGAHPGRRVHVAPVGGGPTGGRALSGQLCTIVRLVKIGRIGGRRPLGVV